MRTARHGRGLHVTALTSAAAGALLLLAPPVLAQESPLPDDPSGCAENPVICQSGLAPAVPDPAPESNDRTQEIVLGLLGAGGVAVLGAGLAVAARRRS